MIYPIARTRPLRSGLIVLLLAIGLFAPQARGQMANMMSGFVTDESGRPVADVKITLRLFSKPGTAPLAATTNDQGRWRRIGLGAGSWEVLAEKEGYYPSRRDCEVRSLRPTPIVPLILSRFPPLPEEDREARKILDRAHDAAAERNYKTAIDLFRQFRERKPDYDMIAIASAGACRRWGT